MLRLLLLSALLKAGLSKSSKNPPCKWDSKTGAHFDLRPLTKSTSSSTAYEILDGDIPCTPETEPSFFYSWNFCSQISVAATPIECVGRTSAVFQYLSYGDKKYCYSLAGDSSLATYSLLDVTDPTKGISMTYPAGDACDGTKLRTSTIDVHCSNVEAEVLSAQEPNLCEYHLSMNSYYGCPTECPVTGNGLCDSHGHCAFDTVSKQSYCYCNQGYSGDSCSSKSSSSSSTTYDGFSVQLGLLITLLLIALGLTLGIAYMAYQIAEFRKQQVSNNYRTLPGGEQEMVETVSFR